MDVEARKEATRLAKLHNPPYVLTRCNCDGGKLVITNLNAPTGQMVEVCSLCDGTQLTWTTAPGMHGLYFSDRKLIEHMKHLN
jgi:hypothetical protein